ncbi:23S rRNA (pseudouridine(1915)-N(3))-methyltransferase RlmH [Candidatus Falkowbacteria bacterium]|nr:23S rRNA (pseudouridine(1915)-N(3))-methyltransferase RlmH [Candidatus Falkowbacteria bacterium]
MLSPVTIVAFGKVKEAHYVAAVSEYLKRLKPYAKVEVVELKAESFAEDNHQKTKRVEAERLREYLSGRKQTAVMLLDERGKEYTSSELSEYWQKMDQELVLVIGGSLGFAPEILTEHKNHLALSRLTLPHELVRVVLAEQLYRAVTIAIGKTYHY